MTKPNLVYVFADQLRYSALACNGNAVVQTPNFDRLAHEGITFDQLSQAFISPKWYQLAPKEYATSIAENNPYAQTRGHRQL